MFDRSIDKFLYPGKRNDLVGGHAPTLARGGAKEAGKLLPRIVEQQAEEHKQLKGVMPDAEWNAQFEKLMLELAKKPMPDSVGK